MQDVPLKPLVVTGRALPASPLIIMLDPRHTPSRAPTSDGAEFLKGVPGFSAIGNGGTNGDPVFRGMSASRLNILSNGAVIEGACPARMDPSTAYLAPDTFDKVTIIKGPETVLWGPVGSAGTVLFERDTPRFSARGWRFHSDLTRGTAGRNEQVIDTAVGSPQMDARVIVQKAGSRDYHDGHGERVPSSWHKWNVDSTFGWNIDALTRLALDAGLGDGDARYAGRDMDGAAFRRQSLMLRFKRREIRPWLSALDARIYFNRANHTMDNFSLREPAEPMPMRMASNVDNAVVGGRIAFTLRPAAAWQLEVGNDVRLQRRRQRSPLGEGAELAWQATSTRLTAGVFGEATWTPNETDRVIAGARMDYVRSHDLHDTGSSSMTMSTADSAPWGDRVPGTIRDAALPSGFLRWERDIPGTGVTTYAGIGQARRFPDDWELFSASRGPTDQTNAFNGVQPERTTQVDIGARYRQGDTHWWVSAYMGRIKDFILFDYGALGGPDEGARVRNVNAAVRGAELGGAFPIKGRSGARWVTGASIAYGWGQNLTDSRPLPQLPPLELKLSERYIRGDLSMGAIWRVVAPQRRIAFDEGNVAGLDFGPSGGFAVLSLDMSYVVNRHTTLDIGLDNIFNKAYSEHLNRAGSAGFGYAANAVFDNPGRTVWATLKLDFS